MRMANRAGKERPMRRAMKGGFGPLGLWLGACLCGGAGPARAGLIDPAAAQFMAAARKDGADPNGRGLGGQAEGGGGGGGAFGGKGGGGGEFNGAKGGAGGTAYGDLTKMLQGGSGGGGGATGTPGGGAPGGGGGGGGGG